MDKEIIGITGLFCAGKSAVEKIMQDEFGYSVIDLDKIGHIALKEKENDIIKKFGDYIIKDASIDRKKLGEIVFNDKKKLYTLNQIVWPFMIEYVEKKIKEIDSKKIVISGAVLFEMGLNRFCDKIFVIRSNIFNIFKRAKKRNGYSICKTISILKKQKVLKLAKKNKKNTEIIYVNNNSDIESLKKLLKIKI
ncbi:MAG TPA: dephospho-CoA kinase [Spirochaetota bacterium]|nr:dephospho-CoA kinase [Spirochaetota bacterium]HOL57408.1 dephospho-CoA kinase [Spirochaetota bacterium]HPP04494.1 dephospho-CoA kinase [Spirochaetota bacterium]